MSLEERVLVINKHGKAIDVTTAREALVQVFNGTAEVIEIDEYKNYAQHDASSWEELSKVKRELEEDKHTWIQRVNDKIAVPRIIRVLNFDRDRVLRPHFSRNAIYIRDKMTCQYCLRKFKKEDLNLDHVIPRAQGGKTTWSNIVLSCIKCNTRKAARTPEEAGMKLIKQPTVFFSNEKFFRISHPTWKYFLKDFDSLVSDSYWHDEMKD